MKTINILGVTGSVGTATADVVFAHRDDFQVNAVSAYNNVQALAGIAKKLNAKKAVIGNPVHFAALKEALFGSGIQVMRGEQALLEAAADTVDFTMAAISGMAGFPTLLEAIKNSHVVAIANKEPLVAAGPFIIEQAKLHDTKLLPVDSEHNAVFQVLEQDNFHAIEKITLTASGGPFLNWSEAKKAAATVAEAVAHPNWSMGAKISVDSATLMNKALEVIEAHYFFNLPPEKIEVLIHPQSIIHAMVTYQDGSTLAQLGAPDMRTPITYCLGWPLRPKSPGRSLTADMLSNLVFAECDEQKFPAVRMAYDCLDASLAHCIALNAANEIAVIAFLQRKISFTGIMRTVGDIINKLDYPAINRLEDVIGFDKLVRSETQSYMNDCSKREVA